jgi:hypothetical protein
MSIATKIADTFGKPSAAKLAERIAEQESALAALVSQHDQAEEKAIAQAADESAYAEANQEASAIRANVDAARERLNRLRKAHTETAATEKAALLAKLADDLANLNSAQREGHRACEREEQIAADRYKQELAEIQKRREGYTAAIAKHERWMKWANAGVSELLICRAQKLIDERRAVKLEMEANLSASEFYSIQSEHTSAAGWVNNCGKDDRPLAVARAQEAADRLEKAKALRGPYELRAKELTEEIHAIIGTL